MNENEKEYTQTPDIDSPHLTNQDGWSSVGEEVVTDNELGSGERRVIETVDQMSEANPLGVQSEEPILATQETRGCTPSEIEQMKARHLPMGKADESATLPGTARGREADELHVEYSGSSQQSSKILPPAEKISQELDVDDVGQPSLPKNLPLYQCQKLVRAAKIVRIQRNERGGALVHIDTPGLPPNQICERFMKKFAPEAGGYFVSPEGGGDQFYLSAKEFEADYDIPVCSAQCED